ncbi:MAG TPA: SDR family NAD(P)-dependent oxidoreductase [Acidimicrobiia bacterium]|nr:SDR family NAD(P)-dependent oxidoreductase [Acidimicrobiia bacterium]
MRGLEDKVAVVTGGGNGIGRACCLRLASEGTDVLVADILEEHGAKTVVDVEAMGRRAAFVQVDTSRPADNDAMVNAAVEELGGVDVLVTAAGISHSTYRSDDGGEGMVERAAARAAMGGPAEQFTDHALADWQRVLEVNLTGTLLSMQSVVRQMLEQGRGGAIVTISSIAAKHPEPGTPEYGVSKAGVWMLTLHAAKMLAGDGIRVNSVGPGFIETNMTKMLRELPEAMAPFLASIPMGRMGSPDEVAAAVAFLASDDASYFTGELLHPDGGFFTG